MNILNERTMDLEVLNFNYANYTSTAEFGVEKNMKGRARKCEN